MNTSNIENMTEIENEYFEQLKNGLKELAGKNAELNTQINELTWQVIAAYLNIVTAKKETQPIVQFEIKVNTKKDPDEKMYNIS